VRSAGTDGSGDEPSRDLLATWWPMCRPLELWARIAGDPLSRASWWCGYVGWC
jgi:hypothetical protein